MNKLMFLSVLFTGITSLHSTTLEELTKQIQALMSDRGNRQRNKAKIIELRGKIFEARLGQTLEGAAGQEIVFNKPNTRN